jgi:hypothetical protein
MPCFRANGAAARPRFRRPLAGALAGACLALLALAPGAAAAQSLTSTARLLAGVQPKDPDPAVAQITGSAAWRQHSKAAHYGDRHLQERLAHIDQWQAGHLPASARGAPLLYPFSGPDFINAYALFPDADQYVFFSLEPVGAVPALAQMSEEQLAGLFGDLRAALNDLVALNFFITPNMKEHLHTDALQGTVPVLLAMMGVLDLQVDAVEPFDPWPERNRAYAAGAGPRPALRESGTRIAFTNPRTGRHQSLVYLALDVSDHELKYYPGFLPWLHGFAHPAVLLKSASYLLHGSHFRGVRRELLDDAALIVQDDTGLPYRTLQQAGFDITLYGQYERPVKLFAERYQEDLAAAFEQKGTGESLPFPFGYNWRKEGKSGLILAQRVPAH